MTGEGEGFHNAASKEEIDILKMKLTVTGNGNSKGFSTRTPAPKCEGPKGINQRPFEFAASP